MCDTEESGQARHRHSCCIPSINADEAALFPHVEALCGHAVPDTLLLSVWEAAASIGAVQGSLPHWPPLLLGAPIQFVNARTNSVPPLHIRSLVRRRRTRSARPATSFSSSGTSGCCGWVERGGSTSVSAARRSTKW